MSDVLIVGGGPAGMMAGLLFARAGVSTTVLEKHGDFLRDFRGDTVHPSTLELFRELGMLDALLARPHDEVERLRVRVAGRSLTVADFSRLPVESKFIALMPQWDFLDFVAGRARAFPGFELRMNCEATTLVEEGGRVVGVRTENGETLRAGRLVIAADGRESVLRAAAALPVKTLGAPMDVLWFRLPKTERRPENRSGGVFEANRIFVMLDRGDYWQCALVISKGGAEQLKARGLDAIRGIVSGAAPELSDAVQALESLDQLKLLSVRLDRLTRWHRPGLLVIGDAAHAMSPLGGVGINLAIQDAVAAANILAGPLAREENVDGLLRAVQDRRMLPTRLVQAGQKLAQDRIIGQLLEAETPLEGQPLALKLLDHSRWLQGWPARLVGLGIRREHIRSPSI